VTLGDTQAARVEASVVSDLTSLITVSLLLL